MIVADTNLIVYLHLPGPYGDLAEKVRRTDPCWVSPGLWRSEFRNVLVGCLRNGHLELAAALTAISQAESHVDSAACQVPSRTVLELALTSGCTAYDCEFVAVAQALNVPLVTSDQKILRSFPETALSMEHFLSRASGNNP
jgi:predicted nucleic acid-binding protein